MFVYIFLFGFEFKYEYLQIQIQKQMLSDANTDSRMSNMELVGHG
jgi:hypothetical protein